MKRIELQDYFNDNYMSVTENGKNRYVSFYSEDLDSGESVQINLSAENIKKLIEHLSPVVE